MKKCVVIYCKAEKSVGGGAAITGAIVIEGRLKTREGVGGEVEMVRGA